MPKFENVNATVTLDKDYKAGEQATIKTTVEVDQAAFDAQIKDRLARENATLMKQHEEALQKFKAEAEAAKGGKTTVDEALTKRLKELEEQVALSNTEKQLNAKLQDAGLTLDPIIRERIQVKAGATADELDAAIEKAKADNEALLKRLGIDPKKAAEQKPAVGSGFTGSGGSIDANVETEIASLEQKLNTFRPDLKGVIAGISGARKLALLKEYDAKGFLKPRGTK
jgi:hypothetical protein